MLVLQDAVMDPVWMTCLARRVQGDRGSAVLRARNATDPEDVGSRALHGLFWRLQGDACLVRTDLQDLRGDPATYRWSPLSCLQPLW